MASFTHRVFGVMRLDSATFEDIEADRGALPQAVAIVVATSVAAGLGLTAPAPTLPSTAAAIVATLAAWLSWASLVYYLGGRLFPEEQTVVDYGQLARTIGFSAAPGIFLLVLALPWLRPITFAVVLLWMLAAMVIAVRQALDFTGTWRALALCLGGAVLTMLAALAIGAAFGPGLY
jgi:hypothetical protein